MNTLNKQDKDKIKQIAILFHAQTIKYAGKVYAVPAKWKEEYDNVSDDNVESVQCRSDVP